MSHPNTKTNGKQPRMEKMDSDERTGIENMPGSYPVSPKDTTTSGGYSATPEKVSSDKAQQGTTMPLKKDGEYNPRGESDTGLIDQSTSGVDLKEEIPDAMQGQDTQSSSTNDAEDVWGVEKGAEKDF